MFRIRRGVVPRCVGVGCDAPSAALTGPRARLPEEGEILEDVDSLDDAVVIGRFDSAEHVSHHFDVDRLAAEVLERQPPGKLEPGQLLAVPVLGIGDAA